MRARPIRKISDDTIDTITYEIPARTRSFARTDRQQHETRGQQNLEPDVQVEQTPARNAMYTPADSTR